MPAPPPPKRHPYNQWSPDARALDLVGDKWTLLIVRDLAAGPRRFVELQRVLPGISTEQLRSRLNRMVADGLLTRQRYREVPPRVDYELTERAKELLPVVGALARWGYDWAWSPPRPDEAIDIGAVFRCAPGMVSLPADASGAVELTVGQRLYTLVVEHGGVRIEERGAPEASARVTGSERAWIEALGPASSRVDLDLDGDRAMANMVLDGFSAVSSRQRAIRAA
ncbi:MAG: helix-turn-helix transcriptional regulator [Solirubrobacteraceae bacterium]|nr:helix-turn-helix transcriptional regulator [Solirubrobacteraceae bacterium]